MHTIITDLKWISKPAKRLVFWGVKEDRFLDSLFELEDSDNTKALYASFNDMMSGKSIIEIIKMQHEKERTLEIQEF